MPPVPDTLERPVPVVSQPPTLSTGAAGVQPSASGDPSRWDYFLLAGALALAAWSALRPLAIEWSVNAQYSYGWTVPALALFLLIRQWQQRPVVSRPLARTGAGRSLALAAGAALLLLQLPLRWVQEANPDWRPLAWVTTGVFIALALLAAFLIGRRRWVRHFAFPFLFLLVAVPWPERFEIACVQQLMSTVAASVIELLDLLAVPALQEGNLIRVASGLIGVEEACSGIRSLQSTLMISLFLGQFYFLSPLRQAGLVVIGGLLAFLTNLGRALFLVLISVHHGKETFDRWHDVAGLCVLTACLLGLWGAALLLARSQARSEPEPSRGAVVPRYAGNAVPVAPAPAPPAPVAGLLPKIPLSRAWLGLLLLWPLVVAALVEGWYRMHERAGAASAPVTWSMNWPKSAAGYRETEIPETSRALLRYTEGHSATWQDRAGEQWNVFFARWEAGQSAGAAAKMHSPRVCLSAAGLPLVRDLGVIAVDCDGLAIPLHGYVFNASGRELYVFYCLWEDRRAQPAALLATGSPTTPTAARPYSDRLADDELTANGRIRAALAGRRNLGQRVVEVSILGTADAATALSRLKSKLPDLVRRP